MKKNLLLLLLLIPTFLFAQTDSTPANENESEYNVDKPKKKTETKFEKFISNYGVFSKFTEYQTSELPLQGDGISKCYIREYIDLNTNKKTYFLHIQSGLGHEFIAYEDLVKLIEAMDVLQKSYIEDLKLNSHNYTECKFITDDGFEIGYYFRKQKPTWFIDMNNQSLWSFRKFRKKPNEKEINVKQIFTYFKDQIDFFMSK